MLPDHPDYETLSKVQKMIWFAIFVLQLIGILSVLAGNGSVGHRLLWTVIILLLPILRLILYAFFGRSSQDRSLLK